MKNSINLARVLCTGLVIGSLASSAYAQSGTKSASGIEKSLAGIRILQSYKSVLARYGAPTRIFAADDVVEFAYALDAKGDKTGGIKGILDARQGGGGGGMAAMTGGGGAPGGGGMAGMMAGRMPQGMGGGAPGGPPANMMAGMMSGRMPAGVGGAPGGMPSGAGGGMAAMSGGGGKMASMAALGAGGDGGGAAGAGAGGSSLAKGSTYADRGGFIWVYLDTRLEKATEFLFNKDGRLEVIVEKGRTAGSITSRGITLGSKIQDVYGSYGWPEKTVPMGDFLSLQYLQKNHLQLIGLKNKTRNDISIVGIIVVLRENQNLTILGGAAGGGSNPAMAGGGGAMGGRAFPGASGMAGRAFPGAAGGTSKRGGSGED